MSNMKLSEIKPNESNPRVIKDDKFKKLVKSIEEFPKMMALRPMIVDSEGVVLGGNMRLRALQYLGYKDISNEWVKKASDLSEDERRRFIIADNVGFGEHDWDVLSTDWDAEDLSDWGLDNTVFDVDDSDTIEPKDISDKIKTGFKIEIECSGEKEQEELYNEFLERGIECRLLTL